MRTDPFQLYVGVDQNSAPLGLLGLSRVEDLDERSLSNAVTRRWKQIFSSSEPTTPDSALVAWAVWLAADLMRDPAFQRRFAHKRGWLNEIGLALRHFELLDEGDDPFHLLGLPPRPIDANRLDGHLFKVLNQIYVHADRRSGPGELVRLVLRSAGRLLKDRERQLTLAAALRATPPEETPAGRTVQRAMVARRVAQVRTDHRPSVHLTPFDRQAMAILVGSGGWNRESRSKLVGLAATKGVSVQGLITVLKGLCSVAREGGVRLGVDEITAGVGRLDSLTTSLASAPTSDVKTLSDRLSDDLREAMHANPGRIGFRFSLLFGLVAIALIGFLARVLLIPTPTPVTPDRTRLVDPATNNLIDESTPIHTTPDGGAALAVFTSAPTFIGDSLPEAATNAADEAHLLVDDLRDIVTKITLSEEPSESVFRRWEHTIDMTALSWVLLDLSTRVEIENTIAEALEAAGTPAVRDRLWGVLSPYPAGRFVESIDIWRGAWLVGLQARLGRSSHLAPAVVDRARRELLNVLPDTDIASMPGFDDAAIQWLERSVPALVAGTEHDAAAYDRWELWINALRKVADPARWNRAVLGALEALLETGTDISRAGPTQNVAGRLLASTDFRRSLDAKEAFLGLFESDDVSSPDLWVLTSLLARFDMAPWFRTDLVVPFEADLRHRRRVRDQIDAAWPPVSGMYASGDQASGLLVSPELLREWRRVLQRLDREDPGSDEATAARFIAAACLMNQAAASMVLLDSTRTIELLERVEDDLIQPGQFGDPPPALRPGQPIGRDGVWADEYDAAGSSRDERVNLLRRLRSTAGTDLGSTDAELLVREAYRANDREVRSVAQAVIAELFADGPNIVQEMLDQLPLARRTSAIGHLIRQVTGQGLPDTRATEWAIAARQALTDHALHLYGGLHSPVDELTDLIAEAYLTRQALSRREPYPMFASRNPEEAVRLLVESLRDRATNVMTTTPTPADLATMQRRDITRQRLTRGSIQRFVVGQIAVLELTAYLAVAEQPRIRDEVVAVLQRSADRRSGSSSVLRQALETERAIAAVWNLRLQEDLDDQE